MKYIRLKTTDPYYNLAVEEYLFNTCDDDIFMLWQNDNVVVIGNNQNAYAEVNLEYARENNIKISRRITGGGAVFHDLGNINYTFITSTEKAKALNYEYFTKPIIDALTTLGIKCELSGRNDIECEGRKFSGNAQHSANGKILHHGTILFNANVAVMSSVLKVDKEKLEHKAVKSHKSRVVNLLDLLDEKITSEAFITYVETFVLKNLGADLSTVEDNDEIKRLHERNKSEEWIYSTKRYLTDYTFHKRKRYPFGIVNIEMKLVKDVINDIVISGDFFGIDDVKELEGYLRGKSLASIDAFDISRYIDKMTFEEFIDLIKQ